MTCIYCGQKVEHDTDSEWWLGRDWLYASDTYDGDVSSYVCSEGPVGEHRVNAEVTA